MIEITKEFKNIRACIFPSMQVEPINLLSGDQLKRARDKAKHPVYEHYRAGTLLRKIVASNYWIKILEEHGYATVITYNWL